MAGEITLSPQQLDAFKAITAPSSDPIMTYCRQDTLVPVDTDDVAPGQVIAAYAVHESGNVEPILVVGRCVDAGRPGEHWWKLMLSDLLDVLEDMSGKQTQCLRQVLDKFDPDTGIILATQTELAKECGVAIQTMNRVMKILVKHQIIAMRGPGCYVINPAFMSQGGGRKYQKLLTVYTDAAKPKQAALEGEAANKNGDGGDEGRR